MINFLKGIIVGIGAIIPGLSGGVMLVIFGLYEKTVNSISTVFKNFKKSFFFLLPVALGVLTGVLLFSKVMKFFLENYEMYTRFLLFGLVLGAIPLFFKQVRKKGFNKTNYIIIAISIMFGVGLLFLSRGLFSEVTNPNIVQSVLLGVIVATSIIVPGTDSAVLLSTVGLYKLYVDSLAGLNLSVLIPAALGLGFGALIISLIMSRLLKKYYSIVFSVIFGLFITIIPSIFTEACALGFNIQSAISIVLVIVGFFISYFLSKIEKNNEEKEEV